MPTFDMPTWGWAALGVGVLIGGIFFWSLGRVAARSDRAMREQVVHALEGFDTAP